MLNIIKLLGYDLFCVIIIFIEDALKKMDPTDQKYEKRSELLERARIIKNSYDDGTLNLERNSNQNNNNWFTLDSLQSFIELCKGLDLRIFPQIQGT